MTRRTETIQSQSASEMLFKRFCKDNGIHWERVAPAAVRTPDFIIELQGARVTCEVKQIDPNKDDRRELEKVRRGVATARFIPNRVRTKLKDSRQLQQAARAGRPTLLVVYDNTPFKHYTDHDDVVQAMFGRESITVLLPEDPLLKPQILPPFFGGNRGLGPRRNTSVSAIGILDGGPRPPLAMRVYHNPGAAVRLDPRLFDGLPVTQPILPDATEVSF